MKRIELGVFIPIANNGWIVSRTAPQYLPSYDLNRRISQLAEEIGFDFVFSMSKWRGYGGETGFWDQSLESLTLMAALAAATKRIGIIASLQPLLVPPLVAAKMAVTIDDISGGRCGINIVTGAFLEEIAQVGLLPPGYDTTRYEYAAEWIELVKRLWTEPVVNYHGKHFNLEDCRCDPKPVQKPHPPVVCAGISQQGMAFTARHGTGAFLVGRDVEETIQLAQSMRRMTRSVGREVKTYTVFNLVMRDSDGEAKELVDYYRSGADLEALDNVVRGSRSPRLDSGGRIFDDIKLSAFFGCPPLAGSPDTVASTIARLAQEGDLDGVLFCFPDFIPALEEFDSKLMPLLRGPYQLR